MVDKRVKRSSTSLFIKELQTKTIIYTRDYKQNFKILKSDNDTSVTRKLEQTARV